MCFLKALVVLCVLIICVFGSSSSQNSLDVCSPFNKTLDLQQLCGYGATIKFLYSSHFETAVKTAKNLIKSLSSCSAYANLIICSVFIPRCVSNINGPYLPCRRVCDEFNNACGVQIRKLGLEWIIGTCQLLPKKDDPSLGYLGRCFEPPDFKTNLPAESASQTLKCYPLIVPNCQSVGYNYTLLDKEKQEMYMEFLNKEIGEVKNDNNTGCSLSRKKFICTQYFPACIDSTVALFCREDCEKFFDKNCSSKSSHKKDVCIQFPRGKSPVGICKRLQWPKAENWFEARKPPTTLPTERTSFYHSTLAATSKTDLGIGEKAISSGSKAIPYLGIVGGLVLVSFRYLLYY